MTFVDIDRIRVKGSPASGLIDRSSKRGFVTPWIHLHRFQNTGALQHVYRLVAAPKRFRVSIGVVNGSTWAQNIPTTLRAYLLDIRYAKETAPNVFQLTADGVIASWTGTEVDSSINPGDYSVGINASYFPDGLVLNPDVVPVLIFVFPSHNDAASAVWYRHEEWT